MQSVLDFVCKPSKVDAHQGEIAMNKNTDNRRVTGFAVFASDGKLVCIENKKTPKSAMRIAASIGGTVSAIVSDGTGFIQYRNI